MRYLLLIVVLIGCGDTVDLEDSYVSSFEHEFGKLKIRSYCVK